MPSSLGKFFLGAWAMFAVLGNSSEARGALRNPARSWSEQSFYSSSSSTDGGAPTIRVEQKTQVKNGDENIRGVSLFDNSKHENFEYIQNLKNGKSVLVDKDQDDVWSNVYPLKHRSLLEHSPQMWKNNNNAQTQGANAFGDVGAALDELQNMVLRATDAKVPSMNTADLFENIFDV